MIWRFVVASLAMLVTSAYLGHAARAEPTPIRQPLSQLPLTLGHWKGRTEAAFTKEVMAVLRVDDYTTRTYASPHAGWLGLYVGYHATQRQGASIHSPLNCLPGAGWLPVQQAHRALTVHGPNGGPAREIEVNRVVIQKGIDRQLVIYWYQSHGRVVASEYWGKVYSVLDAIRYNRTDAALVRVIAPVLGEGEAAVEQAEQRAIEFSQTLFPLLGHHLPS